ncbi:hypothetical protein DRQ25_14045 [Candidatus Fermentibacteria bacterium]|nr:MAG: hypothetical protein DRQ25_14045 [Candidatus Fermentibacteria bacterium]
MVNEVIAYSVVSLFFGVGGTALMMLLNNPYLKANLKTRIQRKSFGVMEVEMNNMEVATRIINMDDSWVSLSDRPELPKFRIIRSAFRRKYGCPTIHFNYLDVDPVSFVKTVKEIRGFPSRIKVHSTDRLLVPAKFGVKINKKQYEFTHNDIEVLPNLVKGEDGKEYNQPYLLTKEIPREQIKTFQELEVIPTINEVKNSKGEDVKIDNTWKFEKKTLIEAPKIAPEIMTTFINVLRARSEINSSLQRMDELAGMLKNSKMTMLISGLALVAILAFGYMMITTQAEITDLKTIAINQTNTIEVLKGVMESKKIIVATELNNTLGG